LEKDREVGGRLVGVGGVYKRQGKGWVRYSYTSIGGQKKRRQEYVGDTIFICYAPFTVRPTLVSSDFNATW